MNHSQLTRDLPVAGVRSGLPPAADRQLGGRLGRLVLSPVILYFAAGTLLLSLADALDRLAWAARVRFRIAAHGLELPQEEREWSLLAIASFPITAPLLTLSALAQLACVPVVLAWRGFVHSAEWLLRLPLRFIEALWRAATAVGRLLYRFVVPLARVAARLARAVVDWLRAQRERIVEAARAGAQLVRSLIAALRSHLPGRR